MARLRQVWIEETSASEPLFEELLKLAEKADNERVPDLDIPAEIARLESLIARIDEARATIEAREAERHAAVKALHAERLAQRREQQRRTAKKPKGPRAKAPKSARRADGSGQSHRRRIAHHADGRWLHPRLQRARRRDDGFTSCGQHRREQATNDKQQLAPVLEQLQALPAALGAVTANAAEAGYYSETDVQARADAGVTPYLAMRREAHHTWLAAQMRKVDPKPAADATAVEQMAHRLQTKGGRELYAKRKSTVETVFAIVKSAMRCRTFLLRGLETVSGEWTLVCTAYNFKHFTHPRRGVPKYRGGRITSTRNTPIHRLSHRLNRKMGCSNASYRRWP